MTLAGKRVCVLGLARSGEAAARALLDAGAQVAVLDALDDAARRERAAGVAGATVVLGRTDADDIAGSDLIVASPGVPWRSPWIARAERDGIPVWSEVELAFVLGVHPAIAITGTNGKTTTTEMTAAALKAAGRDFVAAGNVGTPLVSLAPGTQVVAELSSFQLQGTHSFRAPVAVLLNIAADHVDWHGTLDAYARAKARIFANQTADDTAIVHDDDACRRAVDGTTGMVVLFDESSAPADGAGIEDGWIVVPQGRVVEASRLRARGRPHRTDVIAAAAAACAMGVDPLVAGEALAAYEPKPHRIEEIAVVDGVTYVNDSKATDPHATLAALEEMDHVVLIAGGRNKGLDLSELAGAAPRLRAVIAIGESAPEIAAAFDATSVPVEKAGSMDEAVERAREIARSGDTVLLSPATASFDQYANYEERGNAFRAAVRRIEGSNR